MQAMSDEGRGSLSADVKSAIHSRGADASELLVHSRRTMSLSLSIQHEPGDGSKSQHTVLTLK